MKTKIFLLALIAVSLAFTACEQTGNDPLLTDKGKGLVVVKLTDAPFPFDIVESAFVTIDKVILKKEVDEVVNDKDSVFLVFDKDTIIDLLDLNNGITAILAKMEIPEGTYSELRLIVTEASLKIKDDDTEYKVKIPGGSTSGLKVKIEPALEITEGVESELLLDFDVSRSFVVQGNDKGKKGIKGFHFKPVVRAVFEKHTGKLAGVVTDTENKKLGDALVTLMSGTDTVASSKTTPAGVYMIIGIPEGDYSVTCSKEGYIEEKVDLVSIKAGKTVKQNFSLSKQ